MKKIIIIAEVPDDFPEEMAIYSCEISGREDKTYHEYDRFHSCDDAIFFTPPSDEEIQQEADKHYEYESYNDTYFRRGANWFKSLLQ